MSNKDFEHIYVKFFPSLVNFAAYLTHSRADATEIVNDVFVSVWQRRAQLVFDENIKSYLFTAVKNKSINFKRKKKLKVVPYLPNDAISTFTADGPLANTEQQELLLKILKELPPKCRQVFVMSRMDGLTYSEIAAFLDLSVKTVESQMSKALKIFRKNLKLE